MSEHQPKELPPPVERVGTDRKPSVVSRQPTAQPERTFSFVSPVPSEHEEVPEVSEEPAVVDDLPTIEEADVQRPVSSKSSSIYSSSEAIVKNIEEPPSVSRITTRQPTRRANGSDVEPAPDFQPIVMRMTRSITQSSRRQSIRSPSPIPEEPTILRLATRQPTLSIEAIADIAPTAFPDSGSDDLPQEPEPEPVLRKVTIRRYTQRDLSPETPIRRTTTSYSVQEASPSEPVTRRMTRRATERLVSPDPVERVLTRLSTERLPSPEEIVRRLTTRRRTEPMREPLAPPSSPSTEEDVVPEDFEPENMAAEEAPVARRRSTQPGEFALPESSPSYPSSISVAEGDEILEMVVEPMLEKEEEQVEPVATRHRSTTISEPPLRRQTTVKASPSVSRQTKPISRRPTVAERHATFGATPIPSRRPTIMSDPIPTEHEPEVVEELQSRRVSRVPTQPVSRQVTRQPTRLSRQPTARESTPPPLSQSRQPTRRPTRIEQEPPVAEPQADDTDEHVQESGPSPAHEPLIELEEPESDHESREESSAKSESAHTSLLDEPLAAYDVYNALPAIAPEPVIDAPEPPPTSPVPNEEPLSETPETETVQPMSERRPTILEEELPEGEPGRVDRAATALLSRDPQSSGPPLARRTTRFDPQIDDRVPRVLTVPRSQTARPRTVSVAPGIEVAPPQPAEKDAKPTVPGKRRHRKVPNYPPEEQHPAAPAYPPRETPKWTRPDTQTPPPKPKAEPEPRKCRFLGWGTKPKTSTATIKASIFAHEEVRKLPRTRKGAAAGSPDFEGTKCARAAKGITGWSGQFGAEGSMGLWMGTWLS